VTLPTEVEAWLTLPDVAEMLGLPVTAVRQLLTEGRLVALRDADGTPLRVPAGFVADGEIVKHLSGVLTLLRDGAWSDEEAVRWLHTPDGTIPGTPLEALRGNRGTEIKRRAQALAV